MLSYPINPRSRNHRAIARTGNRFGNPPYPVANPTPAWCDAYAEWYNGTPRESAPAAAQPEPVAWLRYGHRHERASTIHICDSDAPGAFKVYRAVPPAAQPEPVAWLTSNVDDLVELVFELADAVDREAEDIGGSRGSIAILRDLVKQASLLNSAPPAAQPDQLAMAMERFATEYVAYYEMDDGEGHYHVPTKGERALILDCVMGILAEPEFIAAAAPPAAKQEDAQPVMLTFDAFRRANVARCIKWHPAGIASWSPSDWLTAVTGELGELASLLKMRNRERDGLPGNKFSPTDKMVADELADVLTYLDLLAEVLGVNLGQAAVAKFNEVSERVGFPDRIDLAAPPAGDAPTYVTIIDAPEQLSINDKAFWMVGWNDCVNAARKTER